MKFGRRGFIASLFALPSVLKALGKDETIETDGVKPR